MKKTAKTVWAFLIGVGAITVGLCGQASAQSARVLAEKNDDLRAAHANAADIADGKRLADTACAGCHGANGVSSAKGVPNLAGQRPLYLYRELRAYQSGARAAAEMVGIVRPLSDQALVQVAAYYASLEPAQPAAVPAGKALAAKADPLQLGKTASATCAGCHGDGGVSKTPGTPSLVGLDPKYLTAAMQAYKGGQRKNEVMRSVLASVTDADVSNIALYYAQQKPARTQNPVSGNQAAGKDAAAACAGCHGENGVSASPSTPSLAGQDAEYLVAAVGAYKEGTRSDETMKGIADALDVTALKNVAAYYAGQQPQPVKVRKPLTTAEWVQRCDRCHGPGGNSIEPDLPALAAQRQDYLEKALHAYRTGAHKNSQMTAMVEGLTETDVENLAAYYSRQRARAVVYVLVPTK